MSNSTKKRVAFQGERGAFSEEAAVKLLGAEIELVPRPTFEIMYSAIDEGAAELILAPLENSLAGSVYQSYDLLLASRLHIIAEVILPISHHLIVPPGATFNKVRTVQSHPVALAQCTKFFKEHPEIKRVVAEDTAGSAREVVCAGDPTRAAIASKYAAQFYRGVILQSHLEDHRNNFTRFVLLSKSASVPEDANKISLVAFLLHQPGALYHALGPIAQRGINLVKIESRPIFGHPFEYCFYLDLMAAPEAPETQAALKELQNFTSELRVLGCYIAAPSPQTT